MTSIELDDSHPVSLDYLIPQQEHIKARECGSSSEAAENQFNEEVVTDGAKHKEPLLIREKKSKWLNNDVNQSRIYEQPLPLEQQASNSNLI